MNLIKTESEWFGFAPAWIRISALLALLMLTTMPVLATTFEEGMRAYKAGQFQKAKEMWTQAALRRDERSQFQLGRMYEIGSGVERDLAEAHFWYSVSAARGLSDGERALTRIETEMSDAQFLSSQIQFSEFAADYGGVEKEELAQTQSESALTETVATATSTTPAEALKPAERESVAVAPETAVPEDPQTSVSLTDERTLNASPSVSAVPAVSNQTGKVEEVGGVSTASTTTATGVGVPASPPSTATSVSQTVSQQAVTPSETLVTARAVAPQQNRVVQDTTSVTQSAPPADVVDVIATDAIVDFEAECGGEIVIEQSAVLDNLSEGYWPIIYAYNRDRVDNDPDLVAPGTRLRIPCLDANGEVVAGQFPGVLINESAQVVQQPAVRPEPVTQVAVTVSEPEPNAAVPVNADQLQNVSDIAGLQTMLTRLGYFGATVNGEPGPETLRAIRAFRRDNMLFVDDSIDAELIDLINQAVARLDGG